MRGEGRSGSQPSELPLRSEEPEPLGETEEPPGCVAVSLLIRQAAVPLCKRDGSPGSIASEVSGALNRPDQKGTFLKVGSLYSKCT